MLFHLSTSPLFCLILSLLFSPSLSSSSIFSPILSPIISSLYHLFSILSYLLLTSNPITSITAFFHTLFRGCKLSNNSQIILEAEELSSCKENVTLQFCAHKLDKKDFFGKSDPFLVIYRTNENSKLVRIMFFSIL